MEPNSGVLGSPAPAPVSAPTTGSPGGGGVAPGGVTSPAGALPTAGGPAPPFGQPAPAPVAQPQAFTPEQYQQLQAQYQDQAAAMDRMRQEYAAQQQYVQLGQQVAAQQYQQRQQAQPQPANPFGVPQWDRRDEQYLRIAADGNPVEVPGAPIGTLARYQAHQRAMTEAAQRFFTDPASAIMPMIQQALTQGGLVQQQLQEQRAAEASQQFIDSNAGWLFSQDQTGRPVLGIDQRPQLSAEGRLFLGLMQQADQNGVRGNQGQQAYAVAELARRAAQVQPTQLSQRERLMLTNLKILAAAQANPGLPGSAQQQQPVPPPYNAPAQAPNGQPGPGAPKPDFMQYVNQFAAANGISLA